MKSDRHDYMTTYRFANKAHIEANRKARDSLHKAVMQERIDAAIQAEVLRERRELNQQDDADE